MACYAGLALIKGEQLLLRIERFVVHGYSREDALSQGLLQGKAIGWSAAALWRALCFGPARLLGQEPPRLAEGSTRWLLFDPQRQWQAADDPWGPRAANQPLSGASLTGQVLATGLSPGLGRLPVSPG